MPRTAAQRGTDAGKLVKIRRAMREMIQPNTIPRNPPIAVSKTASNRICKSMADRLAPIAVRTPIAFVRSDIILQFLLEAVVLTAMGGFLGIVFGWIISLIARLIFTSLPASVPLWAAVLGIVVSAGTGLFFGIWPASKAARLDPVEALRYE